MLRNLQYAPAGPKLCGVGAWFASLEPEDQEWVTKQVARAKDPNDVEVSLQAVYGLVCGDPDTPLKRQYNAFVKHIGGRCCCAA